MTFPCCSNISTITAILVLLTVNLNRLEITGNKMDNIAGNINMWREIGKMSGLLLHNCVRWSTRGSQEQFLPTLQKCLQRRSLLAIDMTLNRDVIGLASGVALVRYRYENDTRYNRTLNAQGRSSKQDEGGTDWKAQVLQKISHVFDTHVLKIHLDGSDGLQVEGRRRRKNMMMSLMMFGIVAVGMIMIPMGFQFLAVLGGKALLLAKMALLLTSIQGLKKIATSHVNYGLYSTEQGGHWHYDRQWPYPVENHDVAAPFSYEMPDQHTDLLHPFSYQPRVDLAANQ